MKKSLMLGVSGGAVALLAIAAISTYAIGSIHYKQALAYLGEHRWNSAKVEFARAKTDGVVFFQYGDATYERAVNTYGTQEWQLAHKEFEQGNFKGMEHDLYQIPKDSSIVGKESAFLNLDPLKVKVANFVPTSVKITDTVPFMMTPATPAIAVSGKQDNSGDGPIGEFYFLMYDKAAGAYKVEFTKSGLWQTYVASYGKLFVDDRNAFVLQDEDGGSGAMDNVFVYGLDPSGQVTQYLNTGSQWNGNATIQKNQLVVQSGTNYTAYTWNGSQFEGKQVFIQTAVGANDVVIHYLLNEDGTATVSKTVVTLHVGQKLDFIRDDQNPNQNDRIMVSDPSQTLGYGSQDVFIAQKPGDSQITIIPNGGCDWNNAVNINVTVQK